jgi:hypothetical protein
MQLADNSMLKFIIQADALFGGGLVSAAEPCALSKPLGGTGENYDD